MHALVLAILMGAAVPPSPTAAQAEVRTPAVAQEELPVIDRIVVRGNDRYTESQLVRALGQVEGRPLLDPAALTRGIEVLFDTFRVRVVALEVVELPAEERVELRLDVQELPLDLEPRFVGNVDISSETLREWAGLREDEELFLYQAPRIRQRLLQAYLEEGYYFCEIRVVERAGGVDEETGEYVAPDVIFEIEEGPEVKVRDVVIRGNDSLRDRGFLMFRRGLSRLASVKLRKPRLFKLFARDFVMDELEADLLAMRQVYRDLGHLDAIVELDRLEFDRDRDWVTIHVAVDEGPQFTVGSLDFVAIERVPDDRAPGRVREEVRELVFTPEELRELIELEPGDVFEERVLGRDRAALRRRYGELGYIDHRSLPAAERWEFLDPLLVFEQDRPVVHVTYRISQGRQQTIREVLVSGNLHTQDRVIRSRITVEPGQLADPVEIERSRGRITATGFFTDDRDPSHVPPRYRFLETGEPGVKDIEYIVEEGQVLDFQLAGGISSGIGAFGTIRLSMRNFDATKLPSSFWSTFSEIARREAFHGAGQSLTIVAQPGTDRTRFIVRFSEPDLFRLHQGRIGLALDARVTRQIFDSHEETRVGYGFELSRQLSPDSSVYAGYTFGSIEVDELDANIEPSLGNPLTVPQALRDQLGKDDLSWLGFGYRFRRIDNAFSPRNGFDFSFDNKVYAEGLGSDFDFYKGELRIDWYDEFDEDPDKVSDRYHIGLRAGAAIPFSDTDIIPYTERWFLGGPRQMRGFDFRGVGPIENRFASGGATMLYGTFEYRRPLVKQIQPGTYREVESLQAGFFVDAGVLDPEDLSLDFDELRVSAGFLFAIPIPIPITFSFGWPLRDGPEDDTQIVGFDIGF